MVPPSWVALRTNDRDAAPFLKMVLADSFLMNQTVKRLLNLLGTGIKLIEEQDVGLFSGNHLWRKELRGIALDPGIPMISSGAS